MIKNKASLEVKVGEKLYQFICDNDSTLVEVNDVINIMKNHVLKSISDAQEKYECKKEECEEVHTG